MKKLNVAILGTRGAVGSEIRQLLIARQFPVNEIRFLGGSPREPFEVPFGDKSIKVLEAGPDSFDGIDLVLSSPGSAVSKELVPHAVKAGALVIDNTSAFRMDPEVPLVIPEINPEDIAKHKGIIANPNCSTIIMLVPLAPIHRIAKIKRIVVSTYQAASGAGQKAMEELDHQLEEILAGKPPTKKVFPHQIAFNLFSHNSKIDESGYCEEEIKMIRETQKIFHDEAIQVAPTTIRVPIRRAHSESINFETEKPISPDEIRKLLEQADGIKVVDDVASNHFPMPINAQNQNSILVGRIRRDITTKNGIAMFVSGDQILKGAALNAVQIAEHWAKTR